MKPLPHPRDAEALQTIRIQIGRRWDAAFRISGRMDRLMNAAGHSNGLPSDDEYSQ